MFSQSIQNAPHLGAEVITVVAGGNFGENISKKFAVHEALIRGQSDFFDNALKREWKEATKRVIEFPDDSPEVVEIYILWLYQARIYSFHNEDKNKMEGDVTRVPELKRLADAYAFADNIQDLSYKDAIVDAVIDKLRRDGSWISTIDVWFHPYSTKGSPARRLAVEMALYKWPNKTFEERLESRSSSNAEFFDEVNLALFTERLLNRCVSTPFLQGDTCRYHEHTRAGKQWYKVTRGLTKPASPS